MNKRKIAAIVFVSLFGLFGLMGTADQAQAEPPSPPERITYDAYPPFMSNNPPPLVMLVMGRNHKLFYEAYNDASDLDQDGVLDTTYKPDEIDYYGYFDSFKYYQYVGSGVNGQFEPVGAGVGANGKMAPSGPYWSGDFLNYIAMSRMDCIRKVLYGGYRVIDTATETVLERAYIPQDAHSWGKEYESVARDGYDISAYTPLELPVAVPVQTRHMFASTSLYDPTNSNYRPLLRVLPNNTHRIWEWLAKERPVADGSLESTTSTWSVVPESATAGISGVTQSFFGIAGASHPGDHGAYDTLVATYAVPGNFQGTRVVTTVNGSGNPFGADDYYLSIFNGTLNIPADGTYTFSVDGDDAVEFLIDVNGDGDYDDAGEVVVGWYGSHGACNCNTHNNSITLSAGSYAFQFRHEELTGSDSYYLRWNLSTTSTITDYRVRVKVADPSMPEANSKKYPNGNYKPIGLLQRHGETQNMYFGLLSGSYMKNMSGGVLRKNIGPINDEIDSDTGVFTPLNGIVSTLNKIRISEFRYPTSSPSRSYEYDTGWVTTRPMAEREFPDWGNPLGEMMFETLRYFGGETSPTPAYHSSTMAEDNTLGLPNTAWTNPYDSLPYCSKPFILAISDIYPTFDSDQLPGSPFGTMGSASVGSGGTLNVETIANKIFDHELSSGTRFIGESNGVSDGACTPKTVDGLGDVRGLCPEEPTKQGSYYSAAVAHYGQTEDLNIVEGDQRARTYAVGLASPLPNIEIPLQGKVIRLVPFAKSVAGSSISATAAFQPTNTIVDFFVQEINEHYGRFRINYEDVEQGADHDMDAIVIYEYQLVDAGGNPVTAATIGSAVAVDITLTSEYAAGGIVQHMGYIISGSTQDGTYLEVRDVDTAVATDPDYRLDTPPGVWAGQTGWNDGQPLPLSATRTFTVDAAGGASAASLLPNPLWYAAKWGNFDDQNGNGIPDLQEEWDKDNDGVPDTYYYVVNPLKLEQQLNRSFADILARTSSGTAAAVVANNSEGQGTMIQAFFKPTFDSEDGQSLTWLGYLKSFWVDQFGHIREDSSNPGQFDFQNDYIIEYGTDTEGNPVILRYTDHYHYDPANQYDAACVVDDCTTSSHLINLEDIDPIFDAGEMLHQRSAATRKIFTFLDGDGQDNDGDGSIDQSGEAEGLKRVGQVLSPMGDGFDDTSGEVISFETAVADRLKPFLGVKDDAAYDYLETGTPDHDTRVANLINFIRGIDSDGLIGQPGTRNRTFDNKVWKLGDIVRSTPVSVAGAIESYDLLYSDESYLAYITRHADRETVVYAGANDGMLHAFSHGRYEYDQANDVYKYSPVGGDPIGSEIWSYIPQALLPHLKWLADPDYGHTFYVDSKPKVFDARIFDPDADHPQGWGTILLVGLGVGGKRIWAEGDFDGSAGTADVFRFFYPTYVCMDITNPRNPRLLWERSYENLGMSTSFPAAVQVGAEYNAATYSWQNGQWFVVFGSGPNDTTGTSDYRGYSDQDGYVYVADLRTGELEKRFDTNYPTAVMASPASMDKGSDDGSGPVQGLTYNVDAIYLSGSSYDSGTNAWSGRMFKINTRLTGTVPSDDPDDWSLSTLFISDRPITAAPALSVDLIDNVWVFFGTGRFEEMNDRVTTEQNYLYGIKDPYFNRQYDASNALEYNGKGDFYQNNGSALTLTRSNDILFYSNPYESFDAVGTIDPGSEGLARITSWDALLGAVRNTEDQTAHSDYFDGWYRALDARAVGAPSERIISKPAILSGVVFTPVYIPDDDICGFGGATDTYGVYYETGTPYWQHIFNADTAAEGGSVAYRTGVLLNTGPPPPSASIHVGRQSGAKIFLQTGAGQILEIGVKVPTVKSDVYYWEEETP